MKEIKKEEIELLVKKNIIKNSSNGFIDRRGNSVGFCRTKNKRYVEDKYVNLASRMA